MCCSDSSLRLSPSLIFRCSNAQSLSKTISSKAMLPTGSKLLNYSKEPSMTALKDVMDQSTSMNQLTPVWKEWWTDLRGLTRRAWILAIQSWARETMQYWFRQWLQVKLSREELKVFLEMRGSTLLLILLSFDTEGLLILDPLMKTIMKDLSQQDLKHGINFGLPSKCAQKTLFRMEMRTS